MDDRCNQCKFLYYDKKNSSESMYIGEGNYRWLCKKYNINLTCYLDGDKGNDVFRCNNCKEEECR
jgi:hypothetical protein